MACKRTPSLSLFVIGWVFMHSKWNIENLTVLIAIFKLDLANLQLWGLILIIEFATKY